MDAIILAGGLGTRLKKTVPNLPKPLAPINNVPFLEILLDYVASFPFIDKVVLATGYKAEAITEFCDNHNYPFELSCSIETNPLGTGGAVKLAMQQTTSTTVAIFNGDSFFEVNLNKMHQAHKDWGGFLTLACAQVDDTSRYGCVEFDGARITTFKEKSASEGSGVINGGIYFLERSLELPRDDAFSLEKDLFPIVLKKGVFGYRSSGKFIDIGTKESYFEAQGVLA